MEYAVCRAAEISYDGERRDPNHGEKLMRISMYASGTSPVKMIQSGFYTRIAWYMAWKILRLPGKKMLPADP